jgi:hypothetical protein
VDTILEEEHSKSITSEFGPIWPSGSWEDQMRKVNGWQTTDTKWWKKLIWALSPGELKFFWRTIKWTLLPSLKTIGPVVLGKRLKCKSSRTMRRDGHQVMIIPLITLKGLIFIQAHPYQYMKNTTQTKVCRPARCMSELFSQLSI